MKLTTTCISGTLLSCLVFSATVWAQGPTVTRPVAAAVTAPLRQSGDERDSGNNVQRPNRPLPPHPGNGPSDAAIQHAPGPPPPFRHGARFAGIGSNGYAPSDSNIAVGPNHVFEAVNAQFAIYNKAGALILGPRSLRTMWTPIGGSCAANDGGDPVVQYDRLADRWMLTQLGGTSSPFWQCIAVSQTNDPTGVYNLYAYSYGSTLNDYPKFGVWPTASNSAYLATYNLFANGASFTGGQVCAYDRAAMLSGAASPVSICFTLSNDGGYLPADLDGASAPLDGTPGYFLNYPTLNSLRLYQIAPNFANPAASTLTLAGSLSVASFAEACNGGGTCIPQSGSPTRLDSLGDRLMYRLAFRRFTDHEAMVVNHSVAAGSSVGVRWYELRSPVSASGSWTVYQQGTYAPDSTYRWMGSAAMDQSGNMAVGYSASSSLLHPAIRWAGRLATDPLGILGAETSLLEGTGSQTGGLTRWGDYTSLRIDPADDCTFWYVNQYQSVNGSFNWLTYISSFQLGSCGAVTPDFSMSANPAALTLTQGTSGASTITVASLNGFNSAVSLTVLSGCPANATCTLNPTSVTPPANGAATSTLSIATAANTPLGTTSVVVGGNGVHSTAVSVTVQSPPDFSISSNPASLSIPQSQSKTSNITVTSLSGFNSAVSLAVSGCPANTTCSLSVNPLTPPVNGSATSVLTVAATASSPTGTFTVTVTGTSGALVHSTRVSVTITVPSTLTLSLSPASLTVSRGSSGTVTVNLGSSAPTTVTLSASTPPRTSANFNPNPAASPGSSTLTISAKQRANPGTYTVTVTGADTSNNTATAQLTLTIQ